MRVEIYSKEDCGYCAMAKTLLSSKNIPYTERVLGIDFTREQLLANYSLAKTFPVVVVDGFYIGGYNNLVEHIEKNPVVEVLVEEPPAAVVEVIDPVITAAIELQDVEVPTSAELDAIAIAAAVAVDQAELDISVYAADVLQEEEAALKPAPAKSSRRYSK